MKKQTAGRDKLGGIAPKFAELNDDVLFGEVWSREDKYAGHKSEKPDKLGICAFSKGVGNTWQQVFGRCGRG